MLHNDWDKDQEEALENLVTQKDLDEFKNPSQMYPVYTYTITDTTEIVPCPVTTSSVNIVPESLKSGWQCLKSEVQNLIAQNVGIRWFESITSSGSTKSNL